MLVLGLLAGISGPRFFGTMAGGMGDDLYTQEVLSVVRYAQKLAVSSGCRVQVDFTPTSYAVSHETGCSGGSFGLSVHDPGTGKTPYTGGPPPGVTLTSSVDPLLFDALGRATNSGGTVSDAAISIGARSISVAGETGFAYAP